MAESEAARPSRIGEVLDALYATLEARKDADPESSYTARLLAAPPDKLLGKVGEEATEVVIAGATHDVESLRYESADLIYHLLVLLLREGLSLDDLAEELDARRK